MSGMRADIADEERGGNHVRSGGNQGSHTEGFQSGHVRVAIAVFDIAHFLVSVFDIFPLGEGVVAEHAAQGHNQPHAPLPGGKGEGFAGRDKDAFIYGCAQIGPALVFRERENAFCVDLSESPDLGRSLKDIVRDGDAVFDGNPEAVLEDNLTDKT